MTELEELEPEGRGRRIARWFRTPVGGPTWLTVLVILSAVAVVPTIVGGYLYERQADKLQVQANEIEAQGNRVEEQSANLQLQADRLDAEVMASRATLLHLCDTRGAIEHLDRFFLGIASKPPPDETPEGRRVRLAFLALVSGDLRTLARSGKACAMFAR